MSLDKAIKIITIIDGDNIEKIAEKTFNINIEIIKLYVYIRADILEKITVKITELVQWVTKEIIKAKANDIYEIFSEEEINYALNSISHPTMVKLMKVITKPTDAYFLQLNSLELNLVTKFIGLIKEEDVSLGNNIEEKLKDFKYMKNTPRTSLN